MKAVFKIFLLVLFSVIFSGLFSCEKFAPGYLVYTNVNDSEKDVYFLLGFNKVKGKYYPTTEWPEDRNLHLVKAGQSKSIYFGYNSVKFKSGDVFAVFVLDPDTVAKYSWEQIKADDNYLKKIYFPTPDKEIIYP